MKRLAVCFFLLGLSILFTSGAAVANVFSFGDNSTGQTGLDTIFHTTPVATPIDTSNLNDMRITQVSAGNRHSLLLAEKGSVFSFGTNQQGVTGLGSFIGDTMVATPIITTNLGGMRVSQLTAGGNHSLLIAVPEPSAGLLTTIGLLAALKRQCRRQMV